MTNFDILRQEFLNKLNETGSVRSPELQLDGISEDYMDFMNQVSIEKYSIPCDEVGEPVICYVIRAKECGDKCPVFINIHGGGYIYPSNEKDIM